MVFREIKKGEAIDLKKEKVGTVIVGIYEGLKEIKTEFGKQVIHKFFSQANKSIEIFGFASLNWQMDRVEPGTLCRITFLGLSERQNRYGKYLNLVKVEIDETEKGKEVETDEIEKGEENESIPF